MNRESRKAIGILDSGVGGLTVAKEVIRQLPREHILYFGDTKRCPYGPREPQEVIAFTKQIVDFLSRFPLKALVIACNTATAVALDIVKEELNIPVLGVVDPGARAAINMSRHGRIGVIGTQGTIKSAAYERALKSIHPGVSVYSHACPTLVPLAEGGFKDPLAARQIVRAALDPMKSKDLDSLILGCTHYPLLSNYIGEVMGSSVKLISSAEETARELSTILHHKGLLDREIGNLHIIRHRFFTSGNPRVFHEIAEDWLDHPLEVERVNLEQTLTRVTG
ncbi:glutamate racemase [Mechercharimyces sp. CAU 1602]|uniref:glutamate racemase n=1 Tax=Mechercharimyces sp. CAU 1602 TaxID=2973933 RepID=UPI00216210E0|nr:glutamate racemase [Mechercharimyces sp. CAU 1602]MCS1351481.1 glutamate racemase [Mechercharimyces sp. CAU 1602]